MRLTRLCLLGWMLGLALAWSSAQAQRVALVIGNDAYQGQAALQNAVRDAELVGEAFQRLGFRVTLRRNLGNSALREELRRFEQLADGAEMAVIYFAGHGVGVDGRNWLLPVDADPSNPRHLDDMAVPHARMVAAVDGARGLQLVILDACRNNPFVGRLSRQAGTRSVAARGLAPIAEQELPPNRMIAFSARDGQVAQDGPRGGNGPFATSLSRRLLEPGVEVGLLFRRVRDDVAQATRREQEPWTYQNLGGQELFLLPPVAAAQPAAQPPPVPSGPTAQPHVEMLFWQGIQASTDPADYAHYLQRFPDGLFAELARRRLASLREAAARVPPPAAPAPAPLPAQRPEPTPPARPDTSIELAGLGLRVATLTPELRERFRLSPEARGVVVTGGTALLPGDLILEAQQQQVNTQQELQRRIEQLRREGRASVLIRMQRRLGETILVSESLVEFSLRGTQEAAPQTQPLQRADIQEVQRRLTAMGLDTGGTDGTAGPRTQEAMRAFARAANLTSPPELTPAFLTLVQQTTPAAALRASALLELGETAWRAGDAAGTLRLTTGSIRLNPTPRAQLLLGDAAQRLGQVETARQAFEAARRMGVAEAQTRLLNLGQLQNETSRGPSRVANTTTSNTFVGRIRHVFPQENYVVMEFSVPIGSLNPSIVTVNLTTGGTRELRLSNIRGNFASAMTTGFTDRIAVDSAIYHRR